MPDLKLLMATGLPVGAPRSTPVRRPDDIALRDTVFQVADQLDGVEATALAAWLAAWRHHWPTSFAQVLGPDGEVLLERLRADVDDPNRFLKLRRIAIENLSGIF